MTDDAAYDELIRVARELSLLSSLEALLGWDEVTYMPRGGTEYRSRQMAYLAGLQHDRATSPRLGELLGRLESSPLAAEPLAPSAVNIRELRRNYDRQISQPRTLVEELARTVTLAEKAWEVACEQAQFTLLLPWLDKIIELKRCQAACLGDSTWPYDPLLQEYEPAATGRDLMLLFEALERDLTPLVQQLVHARRQPDDGILRRRYPRARQHAFCERAARRIGFDFQRGRLDVAVHPFCTTIGPGDCRITNRYRLDNLSESFFATLHEVGHALYEQGFDPAHVGTPLGESNSVAMHESQARLWENIVGRSRSFWQHFFPLAQRAFPAALTDVSLERFHGAVNRVMPSLNRIRADEVTYNLHIIIRFELERALLSGDLHAEGLPGAWNDAYRRRLGVTPGNDAEGCLQDGHWAAGMIGYFPTYTLGTLYAAQLYAAAERDLGGLGPSMARGEFRELLEWLRVKVHRQGSRYSAAGLIEHATGVPPDARPFVEGLRRKYAELYAL